MVQQNCYLIIKSMWKERNILLKFYKIFLLEFRQTQLENNFDGPSK